MMPENKSEITAGKVDERITNMDEAVALARSNGELLFESPWEARAFGLAVALNENGAYAWSDFSQGLAHQIASEESTASATTYYEHWLATLENLVIANGLVTPAEIEAMMQQQALLDDHDHDHDHHHHHDDHEDDHDHHNSH
jgi:nitrile hydratase accessory protein